jgi:hypothetical protein
MFSFRTGAKCIGSGWTDASDIYQIGLLMQQEQQQHKSTTSLPRKTFLLSPQLSLFSFLYIIYTYIYKCYLLYNMYGSNKHTNTTRLNFA